MSEAATISTSPPPTSQQQVVTVNRTALLSQLDPEKYRDGGYNIFPTPFLPPDTVELLRRRMDAVLVGEFDSGSAPTKSVADLSKSSSKNKKKPSVLHMINISKADTAFRQLALHPAIGEAVAAATGWPSVKFAQDQVWIKPPGASALTFHRDSTYFDFIPQEIATLWITLDELYDPLLGPLEYCFGSHKWGDGHGRTGSANQFFDPDYRALLRSAALREGAAVVLLDVSSSASSSATKPAGDEDDGNDNDRNDDDDAATKKKSKSGDVLVQQKQQQQQDIIESQLKIEVVKAGAGGGSLHNGRTWHGSGRNMTEDRPRRGIGIHFCRGDAKFPADGPVGKLWTPLRSENNPTELSEEFFPTIFRRE